jgi:hypothetical protein
MILKRQLTEVHDKEENNRKTTMSSLLFRANSRENHRPFASAKVVAEAERLRELEGDVYHMMEGVIRRRRHRDSENLDASLDVNSTFYIVPILKLPYSIFSTGNDPCNTYSI